MQHFARAEEIKPERRNQGDRCKARAENLRTRLQAVVVDANFDPSNSTEKFTRYSNPENASMLPAIFFVSHWDSTPTKYPMTP